jgi:hypothetical protein
MRPEIGRPSQDPPAPFTNHKTESSGRVADHAQLNSCHKPRAYLPLFCFAFNNSIGCVTTKFRIQGPELRPVYPMAFLSAIPVAD